MSRVLPILFNTDMVRAILDGRKTVTRRVMKPQPKLKLCYTFAGSHEKDIGRWGYPSKTAHEFWGEEFELPEDITEEELKKKWNPPYHADDILYVRETVWQKVGHYLDVDGETKPSWYKEFKYAATDEKPETGWNYSWSKRPSIHMPKEAARIWLKVKDVRVERLQEMEPVDVIKEGAYTDCCDCLDTYGESGLQCCYKTDDECSQCDSVMMEWEKLWNSTLQKSDLDRYGWDANPWVWVIEFERCEKQENM